MAATPADKAHDWWLFDQEEPIGNREVRRQLAQICSMMFNRYRSKEAAELSPDDFMFRSTERILEREVEIEQAKKQHMITSLRAIAAASGPRAPRRRKKARR